MTLINQLYDGIKEERVAKIKDCYQRHGVNLATQWYLKMGWSANSQYGYPLVYFDKKSDAEKYAISYYLDRMNLIEQ